MKTLPTSYLAGIGLVNINSLACFCSLLNISGYDVHMNDNILRTRNTTRNTGPIGAK